MMDADRQILDDRARQLARPLAVALDAARTDVLFMSLGDERLAIELRYVRQIVALPEITAVPDLPPAFLGVVNLAGAILPVVDLGVLLTERRSGIGAKRMVIVGEHRPELGLAVDDVEQIVSEDKWQPVGDAPLVRGVLNGERLLIDGDWLLRDPRLFSKIQTV